MNCISLPFSTTLPRAWLALTAALVLLACNKGTSTAPCRPGTVRVVATCPAAATDGELKISVTNGQQVTETLSLGTCGGSRTTFSGEYAFENLKGAGALTATVQWVNAAGVVASAASLPQTLESQNCLVFEPAWPVALGNDDGGMLPAAGGADGDAGVGGAGGLPGTGGMEAPPPECQGAETRPCAGVTGNCAKGTETCSNGKWGECSVKKEAKDACAPVGDDADCDGAPNKGCACLPGDSVVCGPVEEKGICKKGTQVCTNGMLGECTGAVNVARRDCSSPADNNCDGKADNTIDEACKCTVGATQPCQPTQAAGTTCKANSGTQTCVASGDKTTSNWSGCVGGDCKACTQGAVCNLGVQCREGKLDCQDGVATCKDSGPGADAVACANGSCKGGACCATPPANCLKAGDTFCSGTMKATCKADATGCLSASTEACAGGANAVCSGAGVCSVDCTKVSQSIPECPKCGFPIRKGDYDTSVAGVVTDRVTGLVWEQPLGATLRNWQDAKAYCAGKGSGWRLPSRQELQTLVDLSVPPTQPAINLEVFPGTPPSGFWSSSPVAGRPSTLWIANFYGGSVFGYDNLADTFPVRCVR